MAKGMLLVFSEPAGPDVEDEYNRWYTEEHLQDIINLDGFTSARRFKSAGTKMPEGMPGATLDQEYVAIYEVEADDLDAAFHGMLAATQRGDVPVSDALNTNPPPLVQLFVTIADTSA